MLDAACSSKEVIVGRISDCGDAGERSADDGIDPKTMVARAGLWRARLSSMCAKRDLMREVDALVSSLKSAGLIWEAEKLSTVCLIWSAIAA